MNTIIIIAILIVIVVLILWKREYFCGEDDEKKDPDAGTSGATMRVIGQVFTQPTQGH